LIDACGRVIYDATPEPPRLAASWFPAPAVGVTPALSCAKAGGHVNTVLGADGGLRAVVQTAGIAHAHLGELLAHLRCEDRHDRLARRHRAPAGLVSGVERAASTAARLVCGKAPPDDSLFVIAFGVVTPHGTIPITLGIKLQRGGKGSAAHVTPELVHAIADYLR
jgi:hypothetical protein